MEQITDQLPLSDKLKLALVKKEGELAKYIEIATLYEKGRWDETPSGFPINLTIDKYMEAIGWADALIS